MKKFLGLLTGLFLVFVIAANSHAILLLSGDGNITDNLNSSSYGNQQFFSNILQGGNNVAVLNESGWGGAENFDTNINTYYDGLSGVSSSIITSITATALSGIDLFVAVTPDNAFSTSELSALNDFYTDGGSIFFLGENSGWDNTSNLYINDALSYLGSGMSINYGTTFDGGYHTASGAQIASDSLTAGVTTFRYAAPDEVSVNGGTGLFYGTNDQLFVAYEENNPVPEPATMVLFGLGILSLAGVSIKKNKK